MLLVRHQIKLLLVPLDGDNLTQEKLFFSATSEMLLSLLLVLEGKEKKTNTQVRGVESYNALKN